MKLTLEGIQKDRAAYEAAGYSLPTFDYETVKKNTYENPVWIHFGAGNIFKAFQANVLQNLLNAGVMDVGLVAAEGYDYEIIEKSSRPHDNLTILATLKSDNTVDKTVVGSIMESLILDSQNAAEYNRLKEIFRNPSLQMASFTITEKGYAINDAKGVTLPAIEADFKKGPAQPDSYLGKMVSLLYERYSAGQLPIAMVSMDNCSHNGDKLYAAVNAFAKAWCDAGLADAGFVAYVNDSSKVSFPWSMIDKITPRPDAKVEAMLAADGIEELAPVITSKNTYIAPFVNAEECEYLVIEDVFPNGRPPLDKGGVIFTTRETVDKVEKMKVCTCLNPLHTSLAVYGCLLGYTLIADEMKNPTLKKMVETIGYKEGLPVVVDPGILNPKEFIDTVVNVRIPNPFMPDSPQRIATDTSQKLAIRFGETIKAYGKREDLDIADLKLIPLVFAGWLRYLMGVDDMGNAFTPSSDPLLEETGAYVAGYELSDAPKDLSKLDGLLSNEKVFGVDLIAVGMADKVKGYFAELSCGTGAVKATLEKYVETIMDYRIEERKAIDLLVHTAEFDPQTSKSEIPKFWDAYYADKNLSEIPAYIGICAKGQTGEDKFTYGIGCIAQAVDGIPDGFEVLHIPEHTWAVFECRGPMPDAIQTMWDKIYQDWLPTADYELVPDYDVEKYLPGDPQAEDFISEIWIPVRHK